MSLRTCTMHLKCRNNFCIWNVQKPLENGSISYYYACIMHHPLYSLPNFSAPSVSLISFVGVPAAVYSCFGSLFFSFKRVHASILFSSSPALSMFFFLFTELSPALKAKSHCCAFGHFKLINTESALCPILLKLIGAHPLVRSKNICQV